MFLPHLTVEAAERLALTTWVVLAATIAFWLVSTFAPADLLLRIMGVK